MTLREERGEEGEPLLTPVVTQGEVDITALAEAKKARQRVQRALSELPPALRRLDMATPPYPVELSKGLQGMQHQL